MISLTYFFNRHINLSCHGSVAIHIEQTSILFRLIYFYFRLRKTNKQESSKRGIAMCFFPAEMLTGSSFSREHAMLTGRGNPEYLFPCAFYKLLTHNFFKIPSSIWRIITVFHSIENIVCESCTYSHFKYPDKLRSGQDLSQIMLLWT